MAHGDAAQSAMQRLAVKLRAGRAPQKARAPDAPDVPASAAAGGLAGWIDQVCPGRELGLRSEAWGYCTVEDLAVNPGLVIRELGSLLGADTAGGAQLGRVLAAAIATLPLQPHRPGRSDLQILHVG